LVCAISPSFLLQDRDLSLHRYPTKERKKRKRKERKQNARGPKESNLQDVALQNILSEVISSSQPQQHPWGAVCSADLKDWPLMAEKQTLCFGPIFAARLQPEDFKDVWQGMAASRDLPAAQPGPI
jgi:hypothetical protein